MRKVIKAIIIRDNPRSKINRIIIKGRKLTTIR